MPDGDRFPFKRQVGDPDSPIPRDRLDLPANRLYMPADDASRPERAAWWLVDALEGSRARMFWPLARRLEDWAAEHWGEAR